MEGGPLDSYLNLLPGARYRELSSPSSMVLHPTPPMPTFTPTSVPWSLGVPLHMIKYYLPSINTLSNDFQCIKSQVIKRL